MRRNVSHPTDEYLYRRRMRAMGQQRTIQVQCGTVDERVMSAVGYTTTPTERLEVRRTLQVVATSPGDDGLVVPTNRERDARAGWFDTQAVETEPEDYLEVTQRHR